MNQRVIYKNELGEVFVLTPVRDDLSLLQLAKEDVPTGRPFKIVDVSDIPADRALRATWTVDDADLTDGVGE